MVFYSSFISALEAVSGPKDRIPIFASGSGDGVICVWSVNGELLSQFDTSVDIALKVVPINLLVYDDEDEVEATDATKKFEKEKRRSERKLKNMDITKKNLQIRYLSFFRFW